MSVSPFVSLLLFLSIALIHGFPTEPSSLESEWECGQSPATDHYRFQLQSGAVFKVIGGTDVPPLHFPWLVRASLSPQFGMCSGSIVSEEYIVTAKHCAGHWQNQKVMVEYGNSDLRNGSVVDAYVVDPPNTDYTYHGNDIAILKVTQPFNFSESVAPICVSDGGTPVPSQRVLTAGFGKIFITNFDPTPNQTVTNEMVAYRISDVAQVVVMQTLYDEMCADGDINPEKEFCAGGFMAGTMSGDSGGPVMALMGDRWVLVGLTSRGTTVSDSEDPHKVFDNGIYTSVPAWCSWMHNATEGGVPCLPWSDEALDTLF